MISPPTRLHAIVDGRVQGVGFRMFVYEKARALELTGWVRNLSSGEVEVLAEGTRSQLDLLVEDLYRGPRTSWVESVRQDWLDATGEFSSFELSRTV